LESPLTSAANPRVREVVALRDRRGRARAGQILVEGVREIARALDGNVAVVEAYFDAAGPRSKEGAAVLERLGRMGVPLTPVAGPALGRLAYGERSGDLLAVAIPPPTDLDRVAGLVAATAEPLVVVVEDAEKPGNLGAIVRSADGAGATAVVAAAWRQPPVDTWNPNAIRASLGTVFTLPLAVASSEEVIGWLREAGIGIAAARPEAAIRFDEADLRGAVAIVVGSEAVGLGDTWAGPDVMALRLPMLGRADSLNVSATAAVLLYESRRQRDAVGRAPGQAPEHAPEHAPP
jgi:TrmH family RNA methyltransferase